VQLLQILGQQLELLINEGKSDLHFLFTSLEVETLVSEKKYREFRANFSLKAVSYSYAIKRTRTDSDISGIGGDANEFLECRR
jgi:hypothetical protein